jgi:hypothetical protein
MGILMIPITAYTIFAVAGMPMRRLGLYDYLPISRARLLSYLLVPVVVLIVAGYLGGGVLRAMTPPNEEPLIFRNDPDRYGVCLWPNYFAVAWGEVPPQASPGGETARPPACCRVFGRSGPTVYKPYHTPVGASLDYCAWQLERASGQVFGRAIPAAEFAERYLVASPDGIVRVREEGMALMRDHPDLQPRRFPGVPPLQALAVGVLFLVTFGCFLTAFRPHRSEGWQKAGYALGLVVLMALHLLPFVLAIAGRLKPDYLAIAVMALSDRLIRILPGGAWGLWALVILVLAVGYRIVLSLFRRAEWPAVREDDAMADVPG